jgi:hypothetical protein
MLTEKEKLKVLGEVAGLLEKKAIKKTAQDIHNGYTYCSICGAKIILNKTPEEIIFHIKKFGSFYDVCEECNKAFSIQEQVDL